MKTEMKIAGAMLVACVAFIAANVYADNARNKTGAALTYNLNGSPVYKGLICATDAGVVDNTGSAATGGTGCAAFQIPNTANVMVQCDEAGHIANLQQDAGTLSYREMVHVDQYEKFGLGILQDNKPYVSIMSADGGNLRCKVFEYK